SGAVSALYGFMFAWIVTIWRAEPEPNSTIWNAAIEHILPVAAIVVLFNIATAGVGLAGQAAGAAVGLAFGVAAARDVRGETPSRRLTAVTCGIAFAASVVAAVPLRGITDVRPEIRRLIELEQQTTKTYEAAQAAYTKKRGADVHAVTDVIEQ